MSSNLLPPVSLPFCISVFQSLLSLVKGYLFKDSRLVVPPAAVASASKRNDFEKEKKFCQKINNFV